ELGPDGRVALVVEVLPPLLPDAGPLVPAAAVTGQEQLQGLGEARLPRPVAAHHQREARPRREAQRRLGPDAPEPLDGDRAQPGGAVATGRRDVADGRAG